MARSDKIKKILSAGLMTTGLTLGIASPALAAVVLNGNSATLSSTQISAGGSPWFTELKVPVSFTTDDGVSQAKSVFSTMGDNYLQKLVLIDSADGMNDGKVHAKLDTSTDYGKKLYEGEWKVGDVTVYHGSDGKTSATIGKTITIEDGAKPKFESVVDNITTNFPQVKVTTKKAVDGVVLYYVSPINEIVALPMQKANSTEFEGSFANIKGFVLLGGDYVLQAVMTSEISSDTGDASTAKKYILTTSSIEYRDDAVQTPMLRLYNPNSGEHVYTAKAGERDLLVAAGWKYEGVGFYAITAGTGSFKGINRLYNGVDHHYAADGEASLLEALGWKNEGVSFYSNEYASIANSNNGVLHPRQPIYRLCNRNATVGAHHYTTSIGERDLLVSAGWRYEGIDFYGVDRDRMQDILTDAM